MFMAGYFVHDVIISLPYNAITKVPHDLSVKIPRSFSAGNSASHSRGLSSGSVQCHSMLQHFFHRNDTRRGIHTLFQLYLHVDKMRDGKFHRGLGFQVISSFFLLVIPCAIRALFALSFFISRILWLPFVCWKLTSHQPCISALGLFFFPQMFFSKRTESGYPFVYGIPAVVWLLFVLQIYWFSQIVKQVGKTVYLVQTRLRTDSWCPGNCVC